ncbi:MAG: tetratricopeptide repeat protein [Christensenellaceae bacterium]|nr:tetratricopeptide repeat protein [Christensenellaceae bacterium]
MKIDFTCPVELLNIQLPTSGNQVCTFTLNNLAAKSINSIEVVLSFFDKDSELIFEQRERLSGFVAETRKGVLLSFEAADIEDVEYTRLNIEKLWFVDNAVWRNENIDEVEYELNLLPEGKNLSNLKNLAGNDAVAYPSQQAELWVCVCGRPNPEDEFACVRCGREKLKIFSEFNKQAIDKKMQEIQNKISEEDKAARIEAANKVEQQRKLQERKKQRSKKNIISLIVMLIIAAIALGVVYYGVPAYNNNQANNLIKEGKFEEAISVLNNLPSRFDISERLQESNLGIVKNNIALNTEESLKEALDGLIPLGDYSNSKELVMEARYNLGDIYINEKRYDEAIAIFSDISTYGDSKVKLNAANYGKGESLLNAGEYSDAYEIFDSLSNYSDSNDKAIECLYYMGKDALDKEDYEDAIFLFEKTEGYEDSDALIIDAGYKLAASLFENQEFARAGELYLKAANYKEAASLYPDARTKANSCLYEAGKQAYNRGEYKQTVDYLEGIQDFTDAGKMYKNSVYHIAKDTMNKGELDEALKMLEGITDSDDIEDLKQQINYKIADKYLENGDKQAAVEKFTTLGEYSDASQRLLMISYTTADEEFISGNYENAAKLFDDLGDFSDSEERAKESLYKVAENHFKNEDYQLAYDVFKNLGDYSNAPEQANEAIYALAKKMKDDGDLKGAIDILTPLNTDDAKDIIDDIHYSIGQLYMEKNEYRLAMEEFAKVMNFRDGETQYMLSKYSLAEEIYSKGEVLEAAGLFAEIGQWRDAPTRAEQCFDEYYETVAMLARQGHNDSNYKAAYDALKDKDLENLPDKYEDLKQIYNNANYELANEAYKNRDAFKALEYYNNILDFKDVKNKLNQRTYLLLGVWETSDGIKAQFNIDGSCSINNVNYKVFFVENYSLYVGDNLETLVDAFGISSISRAELAIREKDTQAKKYYKFKKVEEISAVVEKVVLEEPIQSPEPTIEVLPTAEPIIGDVPEELLPQVDEPTPTPVPVIIN